MERLYEGLTAGSPGALDPHMRHKAVAAVYRVATHELCLPGLFGIGRVEPVEKGHIRLQKGQTASI